MIAVALDGGGTGEIVSLEGERAVLVASRAAAPGTPLCARLGEAESLQLKVNRCARRGDGRFDIEARAVNLTRALREAIAGRLGHVHGG